MTIELLAQLAVIITPVISAAQTVIVWWGIRAMIAANRERATANAETTRLADQRHADAMRLADQRHAETMEALRQQGEALKVLIERNR